MIEREINLLAPQIIKVRTYRIYLERLGHLVRFIIFLSALLLAVIGGAYVVVRWNEASLTAGGDPAQEQNRAAVAEVRRINAQVGAIKAWQTANVAWTPYLPDVFRAMPPGIVLTRIKVDAKTNALNLSGTFPRREALVTFQRQLEALPWVLRVNSPLSNFETGNAAQFTLEVSRQEQL